MARAYTKCGDCNAVMWFGDLDPVPQAAVCLCGLTGLTEDGPVGNYVELTQADLDSVE